MKINKPNNNDILEEEKNMKQENEYGFERYFDFYEDGNHKLNQERRNKNENIIKEKIKDIDK